MASSPAQPSYLIVGAGVFGVSTAYHLIQKYPHASITIVDRDAFDADSRVAASWDWNKVVRADYDDILYCKLALEAQDVFRSDELWKPFFHETGVYWICRDDHGQTVIRNHLELGRTADLTTVPVEQARKLYDGVFEDADYSGVTEVLVNKSSGWGAAGDCLRAVTRKTLGLGVKFLVGEVASLQYDSSRRRCIGVNMKRGEDVLATNVILCAGAFTPALLELSAERNGLPDLRAGSRLVAGGITTGMVKLEAQLLDQRFSAMPVGFQGYPTTQKPFLGSLPPTKDGELKWWGQKIFKNTQEVLPGRFVSMPPSAKDYAQWDVPESLRQDVNYAKDAFFGKKAHGWKTEKHRICWDAFTTSSDFIISPHSASAGLYIATGGSFHGWKFFPILGKYVVQALEGTLSSELREKWAWDRPRPDPSSNADWPKWEMKELVGPGTVPKL